MPNFVLMALSSHSNGVRKVGRAKFGNDENVKEDTPKDSPVFVAFHHKFKHKKEGRHLN
jgi:hypothetical protein